MTSFIIFLQKLSYKKILVVFFVISMTTMIIFVIRCSFRVVYIIYPKDILKMSHQQEQNSHFMLEPWNLEDYVKLNTSKGRCQMETYFDGFLVIMQTKMEFL